jgi:hypothetical protein
MSILSNIINIYLAPSKVFEAVKDFNFKKALVPLLILAVVGIIAYLPVQDLVAELEYDQTVNFMEKTDRLSEEAKTEMLQKADEKLEGSHINQYISWFIGYPIKVLFMALVALLIGNTIMGGDAKYGQLLNITAWSYMISILENIIKIPLMLSKWSLEVYTGLGVLGIGENGSFINKFIAGFDLFALWRIVLIAIGMGIIYSKRTKPYLIALLIFWVLLIAISAGIQSFFLGLAG